MALSLVVAASCFTARPPPGLALRAPGRSVARACATPTPEELLLEAVGFMGKKDLVKARSSFEQAKRMCAGNGGPTDEQAALLELLSSRLTVTIAEKPPSLAEMFPGTQAAPTGSSLVLPGTPSMADLAAKAKAKREAAAKAASRTGDSGGPSMCARAPAAAPLSRRTTMVSLCALSLSGTLSTAASAKTELEPLDYLSPTRFAVKKQRQKQEECYDAGACADTTPYYAIECARDDTDCLSRKRRMASQEISNFAVDPTSSPLLLLAASAVVLQWGSAAVRIGAGLVRRALGDPGGS